MATGKVYIVGAGPGDPELITVKAKRAIKEAEVIIYDRLINKALLEDARPTAVLIYAGKEPNHHTLTQDEINEALVLYAKQGYIVTRLKGGDPFIYGRGSEEAAILVNEAIPYEIVPGITAGIAAPAYAGIPVTHRHVSNSFTVITGHELTKEETKWDLYALPNHTLVIYMGMKNLHRLIGKLIEHGRDSHTPIAIIEWGTTEQQRYVTGTLQTITRYAEKHQISNPAIIIIGEVVALEEQLAWINQSLNRLEFVE